MPLFGDRKREYQREWRMRRREEFFSGKRCKQCGRTTGLELHHLDQTTKVSSDIWTWSAQRRAAEIAKCVILCQECHIIYHKEQGYRPHINFRRVTA